MYVVLDESDLCNKFKTRLLPKLRASIPDINTLSADEAKQGILKDYLAWFPLIASDFDGDIDVFGGIKEDDWTSDVLVRPDPNYTKYSDKDIVDWYFDKTGTAKPVDTTQSNTADSALSATADSAQSATADSTQSNTADSTPPDKKVDLSDVFRLTSDLCTMIFKEEDVNKLCNMYFEVQRAARLFKDDK